MHTSRYHVKSIQRLFWNIHASIMKKWKRDKRHHVQGRDIGQSDTNCWKGWWSGSENPTMVGRPRPKVVCRPWGPKWATTGRPLLVDQSRPTIQYFTSSYTSCGTLSPDPHTATVVIKLVVMTSSSFLFSFLISSAFSAIQHEVSDIHRGLTCNMQYSICNITISNKYFSRVWMRTGRKSSANVISSAGLTISKCRASLQPQHASELIFLHDSWEFAEECDLKHRTKVVICL